jgi:hypothetical protein
MLPLHSEPSVLKKAINPGIPPITATTTVNAMMIVVAVFMPSSSRLERQSGAV